MSLTILGLGLAIIIVLAAVLFLVPSTALAPEFVSDNVKIFSPVPGAAVSKTFSITGKARGTWFFESTFPIQVHDKANNQVGQGTAQAQGNWMTSNLVPFSASATVENYSGPATLVLLKDNPSGLPENDDSVSIPITVK